MIAPLRMQPAVDYSKKTNKSAQLGPARQLFFAAHTHQSIDMHHPKTPCFLANLTRQIRRPRGGPRQAGKSMRILLGKNL
jgi:hypothetical protein